MNSCFSDKVFTLPAMIPFSRVYFGLLADPAVSGFTHRVRVNDAP